MIQRINHLEISCSGTILKFVYFLVVNNNKYLPYVFVLTKYLLNVVDNNIFGISIPNYPSRTVESNSLRLFCNFGVFCLLYIHITSINLHMTNSKVRNLDPAYSICFSQVLLKLFTFLINTADKEIYNIFNSFLFSYYFNTNRTNKHTNKHKSSFNNKDGIYLTLFQFMENVHYSIFLNSIPDYIFA